MNTLPVSQCLSSWPPRTCWLNGYEGKRTCLFHNSFQTCCLKALGRVPDVKKGISLLISKKDCIGVVAHGYSVLDCQNNLLLLKSLATLIFIVKFMCGPERLRVCEGFLHSLPGSFVVSLQKH